MATIGNANNAAFLNTSRLSYIATAPFNNNFFTYSTSIVNDTTIGVFTAVSGATLANCPAGRVLRETGRKLYPGANPMPSGYNTYMVSVYDAQTQLTGFIDPNSQVFAIYNSDKPNFIVDGVDPTANVTDAGQSVFTLGSGTFGQFISTGTYLTTTTYSKIGSYITTGTFARAGTSISTGTTLTAGTLVYAGTGLQSATGQNRVNANTVTSGIVPSLSPGTQVNINCSLSQVYTFNIPAYTNGSASGDVIIGLNATSNGTSTDLSSLVGAVYYFIINVGATGSINGRNLLIIFGNQIREYGTITIGQNSGASSYMVSFICNGVSLFEIGRSQVYI